jgi:F-type H+-transporting ATPase subunit b
VNLNITLVTQMVVFLLLVLFTMKVVWPHIMNSLEERKKRIADGLAAAEKGEKALLEAKSNADEVLREARTRALQIEDQARKRANEIIEQAKQTAISEGERLVAAAQQRTELEINRAREQLRKEVATLALRGAAQLLEREVDPRTHSELLAKLATQI